MPHDVPAELSALLEAPDGGRREEAWGAFVARHTRLLLHVARSHGGDRDTVMDRYAYILDQLRRDDYRRLRSWSRDRRSSLTTWLTVVAQHMSLDLYRRRYGRPRGDAEAADARARRRRLVDLLAQEIDAEAAPDETTDVQADADVALRTAELLERLNDVLRELSTADQLLLTLRFRDGLSAADIARGLGFASPFHVYRRLDRLLGQLRAALRLRGVEDPTP